MKGECCYSITFEGKKLVGRPKNTFKEALKRLTSFTKGKFEIFVDKNSALLTFYHGSDIKLLEVSPADHLTFKQEESKGSFIFEIPAENVKSGSCRNVINGFQRGLGIKIVLMLSDVNQTDDFGKCLKKFKSFGIAKNEKKTTRVEEEIAKEGLIKQLQNELEDQRNLTQEAAREADEKDELIKQLRKELEEQKKLTQESIEIADNEAEAKNELIEQLRTELEEQKENAKESAENAALKDESKNYIIEQLKNELQEQKKISQAEKKDLEVKLRQANQKVGEQRSQLAEKEREIRLLKEQLNRFLEQQTVSTPESPVVYITRTGECFHTRPNCPGLSRANAVWESNLEFVPHLRHCLRC
uniref:Uncharacterized protein n=1 Tax=Panagrolaimus sp. JU765 TaxID=591449 RepID=A0AC34RJE6_9BILA